MAKFRCGPAIAFSILIAGGSLSHRPAASQEPLGTHIVLSWNDLGMHCMNQDHSMISILPPYNNLYAQVIQRGTYNTPPRWFLPG